MFNVKKSRPVLSVTIGEVLATRQRVPSRFIARIWIKREVPIKMSDGRTVLSRIWIRVVDRRAGKMRRTGWFGVQKSGYSDEFKDAIRKLNKNSRTLAFEDVFKDMAKKCGYSSLSTKCCPQCGSPILDIQTGCLKCGMIASYESKADRSMLSVESAPPC